MKIVKRLAAENLHPPAVTRRWAMTLATAVAAVAWTFSGSRAEGDEPPEPPGSVVPTAAQLPTGPAPIPAPGENEVRPLPNTEAKVRDLIADVIEPETAIDLRINRSKLIRTKRPVSRTSITDPAVAEVVQYSPTEFELIGLQSGETSLTFWFGEQPTSEVIRYLVRVTIDSAVEDERRLEYGELENMINEMFPNSLVQIFPVADKVVVRGQARDTEEAAQIMSIIRAQSQGMGGGGMGFITGAVSIVQGAAATPFPGASRLPTSNVVNLLQVPGEHQVLLKVRVAELSRTAARKLGIDWQVATSNFTLSSIFGNGGTITALLDNRDVQLFIQATASNGYSKVLAEPNLITLNGQTATFIAGGQFAVPTAVGLGGIGAASTQFQGFGTQLLFTPTIIDKDRIRLQVVPTFSTLNTANTVNGIPGLNTRSVNTVVHMREGQWLAIAGLLQDQQSGTSERVPGLGALPGVGVFFRNNAVNRDETELIILVSPELVHPLEAEQVPLLVPGLQVTEPTNLAFYWRGQIEGDPGVNFRSTVALNQWQQIRRAVRAAKQEPRYQQCEQYYVTGPHGFSE